MSITQAINYLNEYANTLSNDVHFKEFSHKLFSFAEKLKYEKNINDKEIFIEELQKQILINYEEDKNYKDFFFIQASALALEMEKNNFIDMEKYYENFRKAYQDLKEKEEQESEKDLLSDDPQKNELINEFLSQLDENENLSLEKDEVTHQISSYEKALKSDDFILPVEDELKEEDEKVKPSELIAFIKDEKQIDYPFDREATLKNRSFMKGFKKELRSLGTKELEEMIQAMKTKNEALRQEIENLNQQKENLLQQLQGEMVINSNLSLVKDLQEEKQEKNEKETQNQEEIDLKKPSADESHTLFEKIAQAQAEANEWAKARENEEEEEEKEKNPDKKENSQKPNFKRKI